MRLLIVNNLYPPHLIGGAERSVYYLALALRELGHEAHVATISSKASTTIENGIFVHRMKSRNVYWQYRKGAAWLKPFWHLLDVWNPLAGSDFNGLIRLIRPDVVHTNNLTGISVDVWLRCANANIPIVHTLRDYYLLCPRTMMFDGHKACFTRCKICKLLSWLKISKSNIVSAVIGNSERTLQIHRTHGAFSKVRLQSTIFSCAPRLDAPRTTDQDKPAGLVLGYLGQVVRHKGVHLILDALSETLDQSKIDHISIGGDGDPAYVELLKNHPNANLAKFYGSVDSVVFLSKIDALIVPSIWEEPLPRVAIEAMSMGIPVVTTNLGGTCEIIKHEVNGWVFPFDDFASHLNRWIANISRPRLAEKQSACRESAQAFDPHTIANRYIEVYRAVQHQKDAHS